MQSRVNLIKTRLSQSPTLLVSGSGLAHFATENIKNFRLALCSREKFWTRLVDKSRSRREFRKHLENQIALQSIPEFLPIYAALVSS